MCILEDQEPQDTDPTEQASEPDIRILSASDSPLPSMWLPIQQHLKPHDSQSLFNHLMKPQDSNLFPCSWLYIWSVQHYMIQIPRNV